MDAKTYAPSPLAEPPLCVDCDGTLIRTDLLHESVLLLLKGFWAAVFLLPLWLLRGKAHMKQQIARRVSVDYATLPYNEQVVDLVKEARAQGRATVLCTASPRSQAEGIATHLGIFDQVEATDELINLAGASKAAHLEQLYGRGGFTYVGNSRADLPVWAAGRDAVVVSNSSSLRNAAEAVAKVTQVIDAPMGSLKTYVKAIRVHQWLKNLLVFVPLLSAHELSSGSQVGSAVLAFFAFSFCASAVYVINDLLDLPSDRQHHKKRHRPFASGAIPVAHGVALAPLLLGAAVLLASMLPWQFALTLSGYFVITCLYSFALKNRVMVDVLLLATLYTFRIIAGQAATGIPPSFWLLAFSMFLFLSLAVVKRYSELLVMLRQNKDKAAGRGYSVADLPVLLSLGTASGYISILVLALYVQSPEVNVLYSQAWILWLIIPPMLYWISRVWMKVHRGEMNEDPVVFAALDRQSWFIAAVIAVVMWVAATQ